jgi:hypothetical protein
VQVEALRGASCSKPRSEFGCNCSATDVSPTRALRLADPAICVARRVRGAPLRVHHAHVRPAR